MSTGLPGRLTAVVGARHVSTDAQVLAARSVDYTGRYRGRAAAMVRPGSADEVAATLATCRDAGAFVTVQGGRTSLVAGAVPENDDVLLSTERLAAMDDVDTAARRVTVGAGVTAATVQRAAQAAGLVFGVDLAARDTATIGGMASTNAGGLRTVRYGNMREQVGGLDVALPDGSILGRHSRIRCDNTGYDLTSLFVGAEGTLGVITGVDLALHVAPRRRVAAMAGFATLSGAVAAADILRAVDGIAALELLDGRACALAARHLDVATPVAGAWPLLVELAGDGDLAGRLNAALADIEPAGELASETAVALDPADQARLWRVREAITEVLGLDGPPLKFDVSLPLPAIPVFAQHATELVSSLVPDAVPVLFGHIAEGNLHLNVLGCNGSGREAELDAAMMELIAAGGGNVSSEHGVGSRKRAYLHLSRTPSDIAAMRVVKSGFDPLGYLNPAVLFG